jgi:hypothetical protein
MRIRMNQISAWFWEPVRLPEMAEYSQTTRLVFGAILGAMAVILQSAGIFTGVGYILSMMTTGPIVMATLLSLRIGCLTYFVTIFLLAIVQPSELLVFPFTTGLLGLSLGIALKYVKRTVLMLSFSAVALTLGIGFLLYGLKFPILGPTVSVSAHLSFFVLGLTFAFSLLYSWIWLKISITAFRLFCKVIIRRLSFEK